MKKLLLFVIVCILGLYGTVNAQDQENVEVLISEDFESYEVDQYIAKDGADYWSTWANQPGTAEDGKIAELEGNKCGYLTPGNDQILKLGGYESGVFELELDVYVPEGKGAYYNILHEFNGNNSLWAMQTYIQMQCSGQEDPYISAGHGSVHAGGGNVIDLPGVYNGWIKFRISIDADTDKAVYYYTMPGGEEFEAFSWKWSKDSFGESEVGRKLDAMNFFPPNENAGFYIDNLTLKRIGGESAAEVVFNKESVETSVDVDDISTVELEIENIGTSIAEYNAWVDYGEGAMSKNYRVVSYSVDDLSQSFPTGWIYDDPITFEIAALYPAASYASSAMGTYITQVAYFLGEFQTNSGEIVTMLEPGTDMTFRVYAQGTNGIPGKVLAEKVIPAKDIVFDWNIVEFEEPVALTGFDFYVAVELTQCAGGGKPIVLDGNVEGTMEGYGELYRQSMTSAYRSLTGTGEKGGNYPIKVLCSGEKIAGGWAELSKNEGTLGIGAKETIEIEFKTINLEKDRTYQAKIIFNINTGTVEIPLALHVGAENVDEILSDTYNIYPNPTTAQVTVEGENINYIAVYSSVGQLVKVVKTQDNVVDMSAYDNGVYFFNIVDNAGQSSVQRVVVAK